MFESAVDLDGSSVILWGKAWRNVVVDQCYTAAREQERVTWCVSAEGAGAVTDYVIEWLESKRTGSCARTLNIVLLKGSRTQQVERVLQLLQTRQL